MRSQASARTLMIVGAFLSMIDRSVLPPLIPVVADEMAAPIEAVGNSLTVYAIAYAALQLVWSTFATRWGRIRVLAISTGIAGIANIATALAQDPISLLIARGMSGAAFAATFTVVLVYFGDTMTMKLRAVATANLAAAVSLGMAAGTLGAGIIAQWWNWRFVFGGIAAACLVLTVVLFRLPEPEIVRRQRLLPSIALISRNGWALAILGFTVLEGILFTGIFNFLPVSLQAQGETVVVAGLATAAFGVSVIAVSQLMKLVLRRWPSWMLLLVGGISTVGAYAILSWSISGTTVFIAASLLGLAWALAHTTMQTWMTDAVADARAIGMSFFSIALFAGGSIGAALGNLSATSGQFGSLFVAAAITSAFFAAATSASRARYRVREN
jgi:predicted MFS family arabinose efflux permease